MSQSRDAKRTKAIILDTATKLFAKYGIDGISVDLIAKEANINKAMIYYYFKNKSTLYETAMQKVLDDIYKTVLTELKECKRPQDELKAFIYTFASFAKKNSFLSSLMLQELSSDGKNLPKDMFMGLKKLFLLLNDILERGEKKGCFKKSEPIVIHFIITGVINLFISTKNMRKNVAKELQNDTLCSSCDLLDITNYLYESVLKIVKKSQK